MKKRSMLAAVLAAVMCFALCACGGAKKTETEAAKETEAKTEAATEAAKETEAVAEAAAAGEPIVIEFEDVEGMKELSKKIQNGDLPDAALEIDAYSYKVVTHYSIGYKGDDGVFLGTTYEYDGDYPADKAHVKLTGKVIGTFPSFKIQAESIEVIE